MNNIKTPFTELTPTEQKQIHGGDSMKRFARWLGGLIVKITPCYCETKINSSNYQDYVNPNDPLM